MVAEPRNHDDDGNNSPISSNINNRTSLFFPSEILHSKDLSSFTTATTSSSHSSGIIIIICHKDRTSFYKSTRKARRAVGRVWSAITLPYCSSSSVESKDSLPVKITDGHFIGSSSCAGDRKCQDANAAMRKRLISEFGPCCSEVAVDDLPNVKVSRYSHDQVASDSADAAHNCQVGNNGSPPEAKEKDVAVAFFDLDTIIQQQNTASSNNTSTDGSASSHHTCMQKVLLSLFTKGDCKGEEGGSMLVHLMSQTLYRIVTSLAIAPTPEKDGSSEKNSCGGGFNNEQLEKYLLSKGVETNDNTASSSLNDSDGNNKNVIRRLRQNKGAANCPLTIYPARYIELYDVKSSSHKIMEICRFHNYDAERGCLRSQKAKQNSNVKGCDMDHEHCHKCGQKTHRAFECIAPLGAPVSLLFRKTVDGGVSSVPYADSDPNNLPTVSLPALLVLGGRLRGRTLATCEMLPLAALSSNNCKQSSLPWATLPNLSEHRGSHAGCSPIGSGLAFVMGGGTADGNSDAVELLDFGSYSTIQKNQQQNEWRWHTLPAKLSSPRHAFGAVSCITKRQQKCETTGVSMTSASLYAVGGWKYGSISCESMERLNFECPSITEKGKARNQEFDPEQLRTQVQWQLCAPLLLPRRLHSVVASTNGSSIYVFGGYIDERRTTNSIERYDTFADKWTLVEELPYGQGNCPLVQAVVDQRNDGGYLIFPYSTEQTKEDGVAPLVLRYTPGAAVPFSPIPLPNENSNNNKQQQQLRLPIANWHSFIATSSISLRKAFLVGGTIRGKWTDRSYQLDFDTMEWKELPAMTFARRRLATFVLE